MVVETSVLVSILLNEPGSEILVGKILKEEALIAAPSLLEAHMVLAKHFGASTGITLGHYLTKLGIDIVPFTPAHAEAAALAFETYGKGRHRAGLNFGDCMSYALAKVAGRPLLFVGDDFSHTDITAA